MGLPQSFLDELRRRVDLAALIGRRVRLIGRGRELKGCCPFHREKTPSFYVYADHYHCYGCGAHGDAIRFLMEDGGLDFLSAVRQLAAEAGLELPRGRADPAEARRPDARAALEAAARWFARQLEGPAGEAARAYLAARDVPAALSQAFGLGLAPEPAQALARALAGPDGGFDLARLQEAGLVSETGDGRMRAWFRGRLMFPIHDARGRIAGFGGRLLGPGEPKYLNSPEGPLFAKGRLLFNLHRAAPAARKAGRLILVEGYMDVIGLARVGITEAAAPLGTALTEEQLALAWRVTDRPILAFDGDTAGRRAALRAAERALPLVGPGRSLALACLPAGEDPDDLARRAGRAGVEAVLAAAVPLDRFLFEAEAAAARLETPEGQEALRLRLEALADSIADSGTRAAYRAAFRAAFFALLRARRSRPAGRTAAAGLPPGPLPETRAASALRTAPASLRALLAAIAARPGAAERHAEALLALPLEDPALIRLRDSVLAGDRPAAPVSLWRNADDCTFDARVREALARLARRYHLTAAVAEMARCTAGPEEWERMTALREALAREEAGLAALVAGETA